jgi:hypothetical protein
MALLREAHIADPGSGLVKLLLAEAHEQLGEMEHSAAGYRKLLADDPQNILAYRGLNRVMGLLGKPAVATAAAAVLDLLGAATPAERAQVKEPEGDWRPAGTLDLTTEPLSPQLDGLSRALGLAMPFLGAVYPLHVEQPFPASHPLTLLAGRIGLPLGRPRVIVAPEAEHGATAGAGDPVPLLLSPRLTQQEPGEALRFWIGRALAKAVTGSTLLDRLDPSELGVLVEALSVQRPIDPDVQKLRRQIMRALPRRVRKQLEGITIGQVTAEATAELRELEDRRASEVGMVIAANPKAAITELARARGLSDPPAAHDELRELMLFAVSDEYERLHHAYWTARTD